MADQKLKRRFTAAMTPWSLEARGCSGGAVRARGTNRCHRCCCPATTRRDRPPRVAEQHRDETSAARGTRSYGASLRPKHKGQQPCATKAPRSQWTWPQCATMRNKAPERAACPVMLVQAPDGGAAAAVSTSLVRSTSADGNVGGSMKLPCGLCAEVPLCALLASAWRAPIRMLTL
eukprot:CAMPEP_0115572282 /NCGR_PEP_ID=MMETSP0272-20121206/391_1 /TAXON_ID=71861 /ORGANISM="Scrippsiella trochoidea, Strain CCMP3099" /LENGTH=175 /DNA_ID=CAMNT_0003006887 /DNA_START=276 /DNA_END=805 /DNA_ORIENTATION=-